MKSLLFLITFFVSTLAFSQSYDYGLWLVNRKDNISLNKTQQTYNIIDQGDSIVVENPALRISFTKAGVGVLISDAKIIFADDVIICPIVYYKDPKWLAIVFKPIDAPEARYWFHWDHFFD